MRTFTLDTTLGELIQEMQEEGQLLALQEVFYENPSREFSVLVGRGPEVNALMHRLLDAVREATGAESQRIEFRIG